MKKQNVLLFVITLVRAASLVARRFDRGLGGLSFHDFVILYHLSQAPDERLRRIDLAQKIGVTASGITRLLIPMEKIGLVKTEEHAHDARVRYVRIASGGKRMLNEGLDDAHQIANELVLGKETDLSNMLERLQQVALLSSDGV